MYVIMPADAKVGLVNVMVTNTKGTATAQVVKVAMRAPPRSAKTGLPWHVPREAGLFSGGTMRSRALACDGALS